jgi:pimeloyl-ACP methyl ester carboxylesterase
MLDKLRLGWFMIIMAIGSAYGGPVSTVVVRPQTPLRPYPYQEIEINLERRDAGVLLAGTLTVPFGSGQHPLVLMVGGTGPDDRDATSYGGHKPFLVIADYLTRRGFAVFRFDDRSVGGSRGPPGTAEEIADDLEFAVQQLRRRDDIRPSLVGVIGQSEGANVAAMVARRDSRVAFVVLLAAPGSTGAQLTLQQARASLGSNGHWTELHEKQISRQALLIAAAAEPDTHQEARRRVEEVWSQILQEEGRSELPLPRPLAEAVSPPSRFYLRYDPLPALRALDCGVLVILGDKDLIVPIEQNARAIRDALKSNPRAKVVELPGINHLMQPAETGSLEEGQLNPVTISPAVLTVLGEWVSGFTVDERKFSAPNQ